MLFSCGSSINIWDIASPAIPRTYKVENGPINSIDFNLKTNKAYFCTNSSKLFEFDLETSKITEAETFMKELTHVKVSPAGDTVLLSNNERYLALFNIENFPKIEKISSHKAHKDNITAVALSVRPGYYFAGDEKGKISIYDPHKERVALLPGWTSKNGSVRAMIYDDVYDNLIIATNLNIYIKNPYGRHSDNSKGHDTLVFPLKYPNPTCICTSPKLATVFGVGYENGMFTFLKKTDGTVVHSIEEKGKIESIDMDQNGEYLAISAEGDSNYLIQTTELKPIFTFPNKERVILKLVPKLFTTTLGAKIRKSQKSLRNEENRFLTNSVKSKKRISTDEYSTNDSSINTIESVHKYVPSSTKKTVSSISVRTSAKKPTVAAAPAVIEEDSEVNEMPKQSFLSRNRKLLNKEPIETPHKEEISEEDLLLRPTGSSFTKKDDEPVHEVRVSPEIKEKTKLTVITKEESIEKPEPKKLTPRIEDTPPRFVKNPPRSPISVSPSPKVTKKKPLQKVIISSDSSDDDYSLDSEIPDGPLDNKDLLKHLTSLISDKFENINQHVNTVHLDIICRIRDLEQRTVKIEKSIGLNKK